MLPVVAFCVVSFVDIDGMRHSVELEAESLYEAGVLALRTFRQHGWEPGQHTQIEVEMRTAVKHFVTSKKIQEWLQRGGRSPKEILAKERLRALMGDANRTS